MTLFDPETVEPELGETVRVRLTVAYDGRPYHGFADNPGVRTVAGTLAKALERVLGHPVKLSCAGRTDAGVHGWGQVVSFDARAEGLDLERVQRSVNKQCGPTIVVRDAAIAPEGFDARHSARARRYRYTVLNRPVADPFLAPTAWWVPEPLDIRVLRLACDPLIGEHDFTSFCRVPKGVPSYTMVRTVLDAHWDDLGDGVLRFSISATSFCQQMVRAVVGLLVDIGRGKRTPADVLTVIRAHDRAAASPIAPAHGLCLWEVVYDVP